MNGIRRALIFGAILAAVISSGVAGAGVRQASSVLEDDPSPSQLQAVFERIGVEPVPGDRAFRIPSAGMSPTLQCVEGASVGCSAKSSDRIIVRRYEVGTAPQRRDIVVFRTPSGVKSKCGVDGTFIKRIVGLPGDTVAQRLKDGYADVFVNGKKLREPYIGQRSRSLAPQASAKVPKGRYFVLGDNRPMSCDSWIWGTVPRANLIGKAIAIYWPDERARRIP
jgi:signal peptidase I